MCGERMFFVVTARTSIRYSQGIAPPYGYYEPITVQAGEADNGIRLSRLLERQAGRVAQAALPSEADGAGADDQR